MTCRELADFLMDYLDGQLPDAQRREFETHLGACPACVAYLDSYHRTINLGKAAFDASDDPATDSAPEDLIRAILAAQRRPDQDMPRDPRP